MARKKVEFIKMQLTEQIVKDYIDLLKQIKMPFTIEISNYTTRIRSKNYNVHFLKQEQSLRVFAAASMIKKDLLSVKNPPTTDPQNVEYYQTNFGYAFYSDRVYNIDLKSAYATILYNDGFITGKTYEYLSSLPKMDRLAAVGMCASRKNIFSHSASGAVVAEIEQVNPLSPFFFHCVKKTYDIILDCRARIFNDCFLFSWVDGIYYLNHNESYRTATMAYLETEYSMESTFKLLESFELKIRNGFYKITYTETESREEKSFNIPFPESQVKRALINYLLTKKYNK
jgi:hypothetical protein